MLDATDVRCEVAEGEVTLTGFMETRNAKRLAEALAEGVSGVRDVHNNLRVGARPEERVPGRTPGAGGSPRA